jgi:hypothetical protein
MNKSILYAMARSEDSAQIALSSGFTRQLALDWTVNGAFGLDGFCVLLGIVRHETGSPIFAPAIEQGADSASYAPWIGRGQIQLTGYCNYVLASNLCQYDLISKPDLACHGKISSYLATVLLAKNYFGDYNKKRVQERFGIASKFPMNMGNAGKMFLPSDFGTFARACYSATNPGADIATQDKVVKWATQIKTMLSDTTPIDLTGYFPPFIWDHPHPKRAQKVLIPNFKNRNHD